MSRLLAYSYVMFGFLMGFVLGAATERESTLVFQRLALFIGAAILFALGQWFESASHRRYLAKWENIRSRGKWLFVLTHYILSRGMVVLVFTLAPFLSMVKLNNYSLLVLALTFVTAVSVMAFLGYQEWSNCEREFQILSLRKAAKEVGQM